VKRFLSVCVLVVCVAPAARAADVENPFKNAKEGDWAKYKLTTSIMGNNIEGALKMTVTAKSDKEATVKTTMTFMGTELPGTELKIDLSKSYDPLTTLNMPKGMDAKIEKLDEGKEKIKIGKKEYDCTWTKVKSVTKVGDMEVTSEVKVWLCKDVPLSGMVKMEMKSDFAKATMELEETGSKK
jgi:hypothetical protein